MRQCNKERELEREEKEEKYREKRAREDRKKERTTSLQKILQDTLYISSKFTYIENWCRKFPSQCSVEQKISPDSAKWFFHRHHRLRVWRSWFYRIHWFGTMRTLLFWCEGPLWTCLSFIHLFTQDDTIQNTKRLQLNNFCCVIYALSLYFDVSPSFCLLTFVYM